MSVNQIYRIAENEFALIIRNPIVLAFAILMIMLCVLNALGSSAIISSSNIQGSPLSKFMVYGIGNSFYPTYLVFTVLSVCLGIFSISDERLNGTLNILICKPLYRRDIVSGKFLGMCGFVLLDVVFILIILTSLTLMMFPAAGYGIIDIVMRTISYAFVLMLICMITLALTMFIGIIFKSTIQALTIAITMTFIVLFTDLLYILGPLQILTPWYLGANILIIGHMNLFNVSVPYLDWLYNSLPLIILLIAEIIIVYLANCAMFNREGSD